MTFFFLRNDYNLTNDCDINLQFLVSFIYTVNNFIFIFR